ncbi:hypothetical protein PJV92_10300 [Aliarcobacter butzleri]|uniref:Uncharacterized protein n=1 Tax=Aliarcobacter butzleri TaxID=28197 RepID=A0AAP4Q075_9BACT|nr:hypothetical protein [Aliarcobacter butzleri]MDN5052885.1 hypothetical protein [Aliarcobacter butzleri]MDN5075786.1 hypothetical protein [Aliarcobacter butzleri]MDN5117302.1 hypothetical protein [Aliarcobacter butzleri]MDN5133112.1 hypothetical protein [Aliarcobacter butzleri]
MKKLLVFAFVMILLVIGGLIVNYIEKTQEFTLIKNATFFYGCFMIALSLIFIFNEEKDE